MAMQDSSAMIAGMRTDAVVPGTRIPIGPGALSHLRAPSDVHINPNGTRVAFVISEFMGEEEQRRSQIWTLALNNSQARPVPLLRDIKQASNPRWSPDGRWLAFAGVAEGEREKSQLYLVDAQGGTPRRVCTMPNGLLDLEWSPDGSCLAFTSFEGEEQKHDPLVLNLGRHRRLWTIYPQISIPQPITSPELSVWEFSWSPDSSQLALYYSTLPDENGWYGGQVGVVTANGGAVRQLTLLDRQASNLVWHPDGKRLAYVSGDWSDRCHGAGDLFLLSMDGISEVRNLTPGAEYSVHWCQWLAGGEELFFLAVKDLTYIQGIHAVQSGQVTILEEDFPVQGGRLSLSSDGATCIAIHSSQQATPDVWAGKVQREESPHIAWRRLTQVNAVFEATYALAKSERLSYSSVDGWRIDALFTHPLVRKFEGDPPLMVLVHGGPSGMWLDDVSLFWTQLFASAGYAVFRPNVRGSWGRGVNFADAVVGDMGGKDFQDIMYGVEYLITEGMVDPSRIGVAGWSYGGFMTAWAVTQTNRFRVAIMGAGITDWHSFHAESKLSDWDRHFLGADMLDQPEVYRERSPLTYAGKITTPTLILHGEKDTVCPVSQAHAFYRALMDGGVPVEAAIYPGEGHGVRGRSHTRDIEERIVRWLETYL